MEPVYRVVGIDLGLANIGFTCLRHADDCLVIETAKYFATNADKTSEKSFEDFQRRLSEVITFFKNQIHPLQNVLVMAVEMFSYPRVPRKGGKSGIDPRATAQQAAVLGIIQTIASTYQIPFVQIPAKRAKERVFGSSTASKEQVQAAVKKLFPDYQEWPKAKKKVEHVADAVAVAYTAYIDPITQTKITYLDRLFKCGS